MCIRDRNNSGATVAEHLAYNRLSFTPIKTEGIRFINKDAQDLERHIYKLGIQEQLKESYNCLLYTSYSLHNNNSEAFRI